MSRLIWDQTGEKFFETGCDHGVLYPQKNGLYPLGVVWNGLTSVDESPSGAEDNAIYADNIKYLNLKSAEEYGMTINCYYYPDEWKKCNGETEAADGITLGQQRRNTFGFSYRTKKGNDTDGEDHGYVLHLVYGCSASPSDMTHETINDSPDAVEMSYEVTTTPVGVTGKDEDGKDYRPVSTITIDSTKTNADALSAFEDILYGKDGEGDSAIVARLPLPDEVISFFKEFEAEEVG